MNHARFDSLARLMAAPGTRRSILAALGSGLLGVLALAEDASAKKCNKSKDCGICKRCKKGRCKKKPDGSNCSGGTCEGGRCVAQCTPDCAGRECGSDGCGGTCGSCTGNETCTSGGICQCVPSCGGKNCGDDGCGGTCGVCSFPQSCSGGVCGFIPMCHGYGMACSSAMTCCSATCTGWPGVCGKSPTGRPCFGDDDCVSGSVCRGYACVVAAPMA